MTIENEKTLKDEINRIFDSGANETRIFESVKAFINKIKEIKCVPMQACPICNGLGKTLADECTSAVYQICDVCTGRKIIPMAELKELT